MSAEVKFRRISEREYEIVLPGEDHTIGSLLEHYLMTDDRVVYASYRQPHPLEDVIEVYVKLAGDYDVVEVVSDALERVIRDAGDVRARLAAALKEAGVEADWLDEA